MTKPFRLHHPHILLSRSSRAVRNRSSPFAIFPHFLPTFFRIVVRMFVNLVQALFNSNRSGGSDSVHLTTMLGAGTLPPSNRTTPKYPPPRDIKGSPSSRRPLRSSSSSDDHLMKSMPVMAHPVPKAADEDNCIDDISSCKWGAVAREQQEGAWYEAGNPSDSGEDEDDEGSPPMAMSKLSSGLRRQPTLPPDGFSTRVMKEEEIEKVATLCMEAFDAQNELTNLIPEFPDGPPVTFYQHCHANPNILTVVALDPCGEIIGCNTITLQDQVAGIGPVAVHPSHWNRKLGRFVMDGVLEYAERKGFKCVMLQQVTSNPKSYALYARMGFLPVDSCLSMEGLVYDLIPPMEGFSFRRLALTDVPSCSSLYSSLFPGFSRENEIRDAIALQVNDEKKGTIFCICDEEGEIAAYTTGLDLHGFVISKDREAYKALLIASSIYVREHDPMSEGICFHLLGNVYPDLLDWMFNEARLKIMEMTTLMAKGGPVPRVPLGAEMVYSPSVTY